MKRLSKKEIRWFLIILFFLSSSVLMAQNIDELEAKHAEFAYKGNYDKAGDIAYQLANIYWNQNDKKTAGNYFRKAIEHFEKVEDKKRIAQSFEMLGKVEAASQNFLVAANCFNLASKAYKAIDDKKNYAQMLLHIGSAFIDAKQYNKAVGPLAAAKDKIEELDDSDMLVEAYHLLSLAYERMDDKESALYYLKQMSYIITKDKKKYFEQIQAQKKEQEKTSKELADKEKIIKHQADEIYSLAIERTIVEKDARLKELQLDSLNKQKQLDEMLIKQQEIELENERNVRHIILASLSIFLVLSVLLLRANQIRKKTNKILAKQNAEINTQKEEIEEQKNTLIKQNDELKAKQKLILEQQAEIQKIVENLEKANAEITRQKEEVEAQKEEIERSYQTIRSLSVIGQSITSTLQQEALLSIIHRNIVQLMPVDLLGIALLDENKQKLIFNGIDAEGNQLDKYEEYLYEDESPAVKCFMKDKEVLVADLTKSSKFSEDYKFYKTAPFQTHAVVYLPLSFDNTPIGVLTVQSKIPN
ncbi:MAG: hypothetical protein NZ521_04515, partial [Flammeovirgaceae bacterium]|nr:hypothetical protein [Flammeovirgaceae bacterium]MDW8287469.1 hypothetical protein [Flammeovirgaceae bacterium]